MDELTPRGAQSHKPTDKRQEIKDGKYPLFLTVYPTGEKSWTWKGKANGKFRRVTFGSFDDMTLAQARDAALAFRATLRSGELPEQLAKRDAPQEPEKTGLTTSEAFALYMDEEGSQRDRAGQKWPFWEQDVEPYIGTKLVTEVTRSDCDEIIQRKFDAVRKKGGSGVWADRLRAMLNRFFRWCCEQETRTGLERSPMEYVVKRVKVVKPRDRVLNEEELRWFFAGLNRMDGVRKDNKADNYGRGFETLLRTFCRRNEILDARWSWLQDDSLVVPADFYKSGLSHRVWLHPSVAALIGDRPEDAKPDDRIFDVHPESTDKALNRLRGAMEAMAAKEGKEVPRWTLHDLRRTAASQIVDERFGDAVTPFVVDRLLGHADPTLGGKVYRLNAYATARKNALTLWNEWLDEIKVSANTISVD